jgi:hypothetical protein
MLQCIFLGENNLGRRRPFVWRVYGDRYEIRRSLSASGYEPPRQPVLKETSSSFSTGPLTAISRTVPTPRT